MAKTIKGSIKEKTWIINENDPFTAYSDWVHVSKAGTAYKVHVKTIPAPHTVVTRHDAYHRRCYTRIRVFDDIPTSAQEAIDLVDAIRSGIR